MHYSPPSVVLSLVTVPCGVDSWVVSVLRVVNLSVAALCFHFVETNCGVNNLFPMPNHTPKTNFGGIDTSLVASTFPNKEAYRSYKNMAADN